jgi:hypothetical protein
MKLKRFNTLLEWLDHNDRPPEAQSPIGVSAATVLVSFLVLYGVDSRALTVLAGGWWWAQLLLFTAIPILLAFIVLHRSSWHREFRSALRNSLLMMASVVIFGGVIVAVGAAMILACIAYFAYSGLSRFHY